MKVSKPHILVTRFLWLILGITLVIIFSKFILTPFRGGPTQDKAQTLPVLGEIASLTLTRQDGRSIDLAGLQGKIWIADFIFTHCAGPCPLMTARMSRLAKHFQGEPDIRFLSFSVDPDRDTPEVLSQYAARYEADPQNWYFLTGDKKTLHEFIQKNFRLGVTEVPLEEREGEDQTVSHSTKFVLVDRHLKLRGYYDTQDKGQMDRLIEDAEMLLKRQVS
ncbi:MAG TPA: SCO family protein [bacterium]|nr:SCO family protein [bacterium]